jgi:hypothetical protein
LDQSDHPLTRAGDTTAGDVNNAKMEALQRSYESTNFKMNAIQRSLDTLLHRFSIYDPNGPDPAPDESSSPPRKMLKFDSFSNADSSMDDHAAGAGVD